MVSIHGYFSVRNPGCLARGGASVGALTRLIGTRPLTYRRTRVGKTRFSNVDTGDCRKSQMKGIQPEDSINPPSVSDVFFGGDAPFPAQGLEEASGRAHSSASTPLEIYEARSDVCRRSDVQN